MKQFTFSDLNRQTGEVLEAALVEPVVLTRRGKDKLVILRADEYQRLVARFQPQAFTLENAPQAVHDDLMRAIDDQLAADHDDDV